MFFFFSNQGLVCLNPWLLAFEIWDASNAPSSLISGPITHLVNMPSAECKKNMQCCDNIYLLSETFLISYPIFHNVSFTIFWWPHFVPVIPNNMISSTKLEGWSQWIHLMLRQSATLPCVSWSLFKTDKVNDKKRNAIYMKLLMMWIKNLQVCFYR